ncbi:MAG: radical SAM protein [Candidatus Aminicenantes bacterium]|nr:radical SAM protein [Candidatus Aminicenantes bacterium]
MLDIKLKLRPGHTSERDWMDPSPLRTLFWNVTYSCNFRCPVCFTDAGAPAPNELTTEESLAVVRKAGRSGIRDVLISGGEPFMRSDLIVILSALAEFNISVRIASNGSLLDDHVLDELRRRTLTKSFQISLDSIDPALYAKLHGTSPDLLETILENLKRVQTHGFHTTVSARLTPETLPGIPSLLDMANQEGWPTLTLHIPVHSNRISGAYGQDEDILGLLGPTLEHFMNLPQRWLIETYIPWAPYHPLMARAEKRVGVVHRGCRAGRDRLTINPTGGVSPCVCLDLPAATIGNVLQSELLDLFENSALCRMMRHPAEHGICTDCPMIEECGGGCRAAAMALAGRLDGPDSSCPVWKKRASRRNQVAPGDLE